MENNNLIQFKKERDLGTIISDTFKFIRENWKEYFLTILKIVGPILAVSLAFIVFYMLAFSDIFSDPDNLTNNPAGALATMFSWIGGIIFVYIVLYTLLSMSSLYFIKSYIKNNGKPDFAEVKDNVFKNIWKFLGLGVLATISVIFGMMLCYAPGIYLAVALSLSTSIMIFEDKSVGDSFSHSFTLIKDNWWNTFGVLIVISVLIGILGMAFSVPSFIYQMVQMGTTVDESDPTAIFSLFKDPIYLALTVGSYIFQFMLQSITLISIVFIYFDLNEQKNATGTFERIDNLGNSNNE